MIEGCNWQFDKAISLGKAVQTIDQDLLEIAHAILL